MKTLRILLIVIAVICIGVAVSYPIRYKIELDQTESELEELSGMRRRALEAMSAETSDTPLARILAEAEKVLDA